MYPLRAGAAGPVRRSRDRPHGCPRAGSAMMLVWSVVAFVTSSAVSMVLSEHPFQSFLRSTYTPLILAGNGLLATPERHGECRRRVALRRVVGVAGRHRRGARERQSQCTPRRARRGGGAPSPALVAIRATWRRPACRDRK